MIGLAYTEELRALEKAVALTVVGKPAWKLSGVEELMCRLSTLGFNVALHTTTAGFCADVAKGPIVYDRTADSTRTTPAGSFVRCVDPSYPGVALARATLAAMDQWPIIKETT